MDLDVVQAGYTTYGQLAGILMLDSQSPRAPGDLGNALSFSFPVRYGIATGFPFNDLLTGHKQNLPIVIETVRALQKEGVRFIAADCGLFSIFHEELSQSCAIPFISSSLMLIPFLRKMLPARMIGVLTGDARILSNDHLTPVGASLENIVWQGMENSPEFSRVVIKREGDLSLTRLQAEVIAAGLQLVHKNPGIGAVILECTNLITFKKALQVRLRLPVYDLLSLVGLIADGFIYKEFTPTFV